MLCLKRIPPFIILIVLCLSPTLVYAEENKSRTFIVEMTEVLTPPVLTPNTRLSDLITTETHVNIRSETVSTERPPRQRNPELSEDQLVVIGLDNAGIEIMRTLILDPRFVRSEAFGANGIVSSEKHLLTEAVFGVTLPDNERLSSIEIYQPHWNGQQYLLRLQGKATLSQQGGKQ